MFGFKHPLHYTPNLLAIIHCTQELISALDLHTVPWSQVPRHLKQRLALPLEDRGIDSLALNLTVAVQAKDYSNSVVPLNRFFGYAQVGSFAVDWVKHRLRGMTLWWGEYSGTILHHSFVVYTIQGFGWDLVFGYFWKLDWMYWVAPLLARLATFYFMAKAENSSLKPFVRQLVVATNETTQLPDYWQQMSGAIHRRYTNAEIEAWRPSVLDLQSVGF